MTIYVSRRILDLIDQERAYGGDLRGDYQLAEGETTSTCRSGESNQ